MVDEMTTFHSCKTWDLVSFPPSKKIVGCRWIFIVKMKPDGQIDLHKACLIAKGSRIENVNVVVLVLVAAEVVEVDVVVLLFHDMSGRYCIVHSRARILIERWEQHRIGCPRGMNCS